MNRRPRCACGCDNALDEINYKELYFPGQGWKKVNRKCFIREWFGEPSGGDIGKISIARVECVEAGDSYED